MYRKGVSALIQNNKKEFLIVNLMSFDPNYYAVPGGGIENGESMEDAVYREIKEELGISKHLLKLVGKNDKPLRFEFKEIKLNRDGNSYSGSERYFFAFSFLGTNSDIRLNEEEVRDYKWVRFDNLKNFLLFENQLQDTLQMINKLFK